jgi:hypothetical protein
MPLKYFSTIMLVKILKYVIHCVGKGMENTSSIITDAKAKLGLRFE